MILKVIKKIYNFNYIPYILLLTLIIAFYAGIYFNKMPIAYINEGDIGRDLYVFYLVSKGQLPYIDFNWIYGPLIPILYGNFFKLFGVSILNAVSLWYLIFIASIYLIFFVVKDITNSFLAFVASLMIVLYYCFYIQTFNHIIGIPFIILSIYCFYKYINSFKDKYLYFLVLSGFLLTITKLNIALGIIFPIWFGLFLFAFKNKRTLKPVIYSFLLFIFFSFLVYFLLIVNSPIDQLAKSFPYTSKFITHSQNGLLYDLFYTDLSLLTLDPSTYTTYFFIYNIVNMNLWYILVPISGFILSFIIYKFEKGITETFAFIFLLSLIAILTCHEFFIAGTTYSLRFWVLPINAILLAYMCFYIIKNNFISKKLPLYAFITYVIVFILFISFQMYNDYNYNKHTAAYYPLERAKTGFIFYDWLLTFNSGIDYIKKNVKPGEKLFSLPYNMLYNFISERDQPSRYLEMYYLSNINTNDEYKIIDDIEKNKVNVILYSYKQGPIFGGVGIFGSTHCKILDKYIKENYYIDTSFYYTEAKDISIPTVFYKRKIPFNNMNTVNKDIK